MKIFKVTLVNQEKKQIFIINYSTGKVPKNTLRPC